MIKLFVPGRVCLFGEHSDWAAQYRKFNSHIEKGHTITATTSQGLYAQVTHHHQFLYHYGETTFVCDMNLDDLRNVAESGNFWSYICGVAYQMKLHYGVKGIEIFNYKADLPVKKGLSSSAAACVLVARAFNQLYNLNLSEREEMEIAYKGEITTPSRCGRMDQSVAFHQQPVHMTYDGDNIEVETLDVKNRIHMIIADLNGRKNTIKILSDLHRAYPFPMMNVHEDVHLFLGSINIDIIDRAIEFIQEGNSEKLGTLMNEAQEKFFKYMTPSSPDQLNAPLLRDILSQEKIRDLTFGGKGVGSQGDGSVQFVCRDEFSQEKLSNLLSVEYGIKAYTLLL